MSIRHVFWFVVLTGLTSVCGGQEQGIRAPKTPPGMFFPPPGESLELQERRLPADVGMTATFVEGLKPLVAGCWALWRYGYLVHVEGDFNATGDVASLRKTFHAGFMTWVNTDGDFYPGADRAWAWAAGAGGTRVLWNRNNGIVFAAFGADKGPSSNGIPHVIERSIHQEHPSGTNTGRFAKWSKIELTFHGPVSKGRGEPNPFAVRLAVDFCSPGGKRYHVPGFYDGDGGGGLDGDVWKVRFSADESGPWTFTTISENEHLNGKAGRFAVTDVPSTAEGFWKSGRLEAVGTSTNAIRYLKFRDGPFWLKAGCDDPENFLGNSRNYDTLDKRKAAIDYLAEHGINSLYIMTHNIDGDDKDVWPWLGNSPRQAKANGSSDVRFDVARLEEWRQLFDHMQTRGVVTYLVLEDDSAWKGYDHQRYYREMIARFGYLPGLIFNFNEESNENYKLPEALAYMRQLADLDPYDHPRGIHNVNTPNDGYVDAPHIDFTSIQIGSPGGRELDATSSNSRAIDWIECCRSRGQRVLMVGFDEGRPEEDRRAWWSAYLGGAVWEAHVLPPYDRPMSAWERVWTELGGARTFIESMPFWEMEPANDVVRNGKAFCLAKRGEVYALYLPEGDTIRVDLPSDRDYEVEWWNPNQGRSGRFSERGRLRGGSQMLTAPGAEDWAARVMSRSPTTRSDAK